MGLAFLNKKAFHTGSFMNIEKVWIAEQKEKDRLRKIEEHKKKLKEEKQIEELKKMQVDAGLIPASHLQRMDWMYNATQSKLTTAEEYLLGKPIDEDSKKEEELHKDKNQPIIKETNINDENEEFTKFHEDPLVFITKQNLKAKQNIVDNPYQMKKIITEIQQLKSTKHTHNKHHHKHHHNTKEKRNSDKYYLEDKKSNSNSRSRSRSKSKEKYINKYKLYEKEPHTFINSSLKSKINDDLGPSQEFKRLREQNKIIDDLNYKSSRNKTTLSEEQREQRLREMKENAERIENERFELYKKDEELYLKNKDSKPTNILQNFSHELYANQDGNVENGIKRKGIVVQKLSTLNKNE